MGRLYDALGSRLEHFIDRSTGRGFRSGKPPVQLELSLQLVRTNSIDSIATDATAQNNPGPGRNVGRLFDALGTRIEGLLNRRAGRLKLGPDAVAQKIRNLYQHRDLRRSTEEYETMKKLCVGF